MAKNTTTPKRRQYPAECPVCKAEMGGDIPWFIERVTEGYVEEAQDNLNIAFGQAEGKGLDLLVRAAKLCGEQEARSALIGIEVPNGG